MANYKNTSKGELIAIYRLEFYKNKKKWKFCKNERQLKKEGPSKQKLNETYNVEDEPLPEVDPPEPLNDAFLETDSDENLKEDLKPEPPPPTLRRWKNTILDMKPPPEERDWAIPDVKAELGWEPSIEPVRSYEDEWGEDPGWDGVEKWEDDQCVEQVYASELCVSGGRCSRLPVFAGWPAHGPPDAMLQQLVQNLAPHNSGQTPREPHALRPQMASGPLAQNAHFGQNTGHVRRNTEILDRSFKLNTNQNDPYIEEPEILKQNLYQNCKIGQIIEQNLRHDIGQKMVELDQMEWEPERDLCELGGEGRGGACVAEAAPALAEAQGWLTGSLQHFYLEPARGEASCDWSLCSGDSAAFVRGAHARAHSSEVELSRDSPCECASLSASKLAHMSSAALCDALRVHTAAARRVMHELRARAHHYTHTQQPCPLSRDVTHESLPTRDTAPQPARVTSPHVPSPHIPSPHIPSPHIPSPHIPSPHIPSPHIPSPHIPSPHEATLRDAPGGRGRGRRVLTK